MSFLLDDQRLCEYVKYCGRSTSVARVAAAVVDVAHVLMPTTPGWIVNGFEPDQPPNDDDPLDRYKTCPCDPVELCQDACDD